MDSGSAPMNKCPVCKHFMICHVNGTCEVRIEDHRSLYIDLPMCGCKGPADAEPTKAG